MVIGLELAEGENDNGSDDNCAYQDSQGDYVALVLPVGNPTERTTTTHKSMGKSLFAVATRSGDGFYHPAILTCR